MNFQHNLLPFDGQVYYLARFVSETESERCYRLLLSTIDWKQEPIRIFGKQVMQPRLTSWYGERDYSYSGVTLSSRSFPKILEEIRRNVEKTTGLKFNSALLNLYRGGSDSMGWHRDNEKELGAAPAIASVSFGASRKFRLRHYRDKKPTVDMMLSDGSLLLMCGVTQLHWEHAVPKTNQETGPRINITFRHIK